MKKSKQIELLDYSEIEISIKEYPNEYYCLEKGLKNIPNFELTQKNLIHNKNYQFVTFREKKEMDNDDLIIKILKNFNGDSDSFIIKTGGFCGSLRTKFCNFKISSRFKDIFLERMLNFLCDIYLDDIFKKTDEKEKEGMNQNIFILIFLFLKELEQALIIGLPKNYKTIKDRTLFLRGSIDFNNYVKKDIPFKGIISIKYKEQYFNEYIVAIIHKTLSIIDKNIIFSREITNKLKKFKQFLWEYKTKIEFNNEIFRKIKTDKILQNPLYARYKKVLKYAELIIKNQNIDELEEENQSEFSGFLFNVTELFEIYIEKLIYRNINNILIQPQKSYKVYDNLFFERKIIPDLVIENFKNEEIMVLDVKYKEMNFIGRTKNSMGDLDREDFFQMHTYISNFISKQNFIGGGLIFPIRKEYPTKNINFSKYFIDKKLDKIFFIDGICLNKLYKNQNDSEKETKNLTEFLIQSEKEFISRLNNYLYSNNKK